MNYNGNYPYGGAPKGLHREKTVAVGSLPANGFGLHEMHGNVYEWCEDVYGSQYYSKAASRNGDNACTSGSGSRISRGGSWDGLAGNCRSANRGGNHELFRGNHELFRGYHELFRGYFLGFRPDFSLAP